MADRAPSGAWPSRYELLDGLRGIAALTVVLHHLGVIEAGHFAVLVFFVISGYCITASAESSRRNGLGFGRFMLRRVTRIYPPYLLAILFYSASRAVKALTGGHNDLNRPLLDWVQNLTLTQWVSSIWHPLTWPSDNPHLFVSAFWSLNYEEQFYLIVAIGLALAAAVRVPLIASSLLLAGAGLAWNWIIPGSRVYGMFIEYWAHFALGSCLYFVLCVYTGRRSRLLFLGAVLLLAVACLTRILPWTTTALQDLRSMVELSFLSAVTLGLFWLRPLSKRISDSALWRPVAWLGAISYSLYLIHQFNLTLATAIAGHMLPGSSPHFLLIAATIAVHIALAAGFWYLCERPFLNSHRAVVPPPLRAAAEAPRVA
ncbi:MAG TPA: acyltransferase [Steroidobacteraceae bacterium]|nr:acyltransferase [Steroidobacteraceae bacterium]